MVWKMRFGLRREANKDLNGTELGDRGRSAESVLENRTAGMLEDRTRGFGMGMGRDQRIGEIQNCIAVLGDKLEDRTSDLQVDCGTPLPEVVLTREREREGRSCCAPCAPPLGGLRVEKIEGGLLVAGVAVAANCQLVLPVFGFLFLLVGCVLTAASYRGRGADEGPEHYAARVQFTGTSRALGPLLLAAGALMAALGAALCALARYAARAHQRLGFRCPLHGDFYPLSPQATQRTIAALEKGGWGWRQWCPRSAAPQCPRGRGARSPGPPCPAPLPFLVTSMSGLSAPGAPLSPTQTFGSIRSLSGPREVASFPLSRTPSPPPPPHKSSICDVESALNSPMATGEQSETFAFVSHPSHEFQSVECRLTTMEQLNNVRNSVENELQASIRKPDSTPTSSTRKTVSVILPSSGKG